MLFAELVPLTEKLRAKDYHITIETAGTVYLPVHGDLMSISPKLSNSTPKDAPRDWRMRHDRVRQAPNVIRQLVRDYYYQFKFVCGKPDDVDESVDFLEQFPEVCRQRVMLMPQGTTPSELQRVSAWLEPLCRKLQLTYCPRRHIEWFGAIRGT
jgi:7-carboxy-7-deazaguanine synthase